MRSCSKILLVRLGHLGDVVLITPSIRAVREKYPKAEIWVVVREEYQDLLQLNPHITGLIIAKKNDVNRLAVLQKRLVEVTGSQPFDLAIDLHDTSASSIWVYASQAATKCGLASYPRLGWTHTLRWDLHKHYIENFADVLKSVNIHTHEKNPEIFLDKKAEEKVLTFLLKNNLSEMSFILIHPFSTYASKCWPKEHYARLIETVQEATPVPVLISGGAQDIVESKYFNGVINAAGLFTLAETCQLISKAKMLISGDSGPMHIASALKVPVIALFGPTLPEVTGPWGQLENVIQCAKPKSHFHYFQKEEETQLSMREISPHLVYQKVHKLLRCITDIMDC